LLPNRERIHIWDDKLPWKAEQIVNIWRMDKDGRSYYSPRMLDPFVDPDLTVMEQKDFKNNYVRKLFAK
jgi:hypothetical protein